MKTRILIGASFFASCCAFLPRAGAAPAVLPGTLPASLPATNPASQPANAEAARGPASAPAAKPNEAAKEVAKEVVKAAGIKLQLQAVNAPVALRAQIQQNDPVAQQRQMVEGQKNAIMGMPEAGTYKPDDLLRLSLVDGLLKAESGVAAGPNIAGQNRVKVEGSKSAWTVMAQNFARMGGRGSYVVVARYDFDQLAEDQQWSTVLNINDGRVFVNSQGVAGNVSYQQFNGTCMLNVYSFRNQGRQPLNIQSPNLIQMQADHPEEVRKYLRPMLARLSSDDILRPGAADIYFALTELRPDEKATQAVEALLPKLDSESFWVRDAASKDLAKLGNPGLLAAMRMETAPLTEEQKNRLATFVSGERRRAMDDPAEQAKDVYFLAECLEDDDAGVRAAAKARLEALVNHPIAFDTALPKSKRQEAVDALRKTIKKEVEKLTPAPAAGDPAKPQGEQKQFPLLNAKILR